MILQDMEQYREQMLQEVKDFREKMFEEMKGFFESLRNQELDRTRIGVYTQEQDAKRVINEEKGTRVYFEDLAQVREGQGERQSVNEEKALDIYHEKYLTRNETLNSTAFLIGQHLFGYPYHTSGVGKDGRFWKDVARYGFVKAKYFEALRQGDYASAWGWGRDAGLSDRQIWADIGVSRALRGEEQLGMKFIMKYGYDAYKKVMAIQALGRRDFWAALRHGGVEWALKTLDYKLNDKWVELREKAKERIVEAIVASSIWAGQQLEKLGAKIYSTLSNLFSKGEQEQKALGEGEGRVLALEKQVTELTYTNADGKLVVAPKNEFPVKAKIVGVEEQLNEIKEKLQGLDKAQTTKIENVEKEQYEKQMQENIEKAKQLEGLEQAQKEGKLIIIDTKNVKVAGKDYKVIDAYNGRVVIDLNKDKEGAKKVEEKAEKKVETKAEERKAEEKEEKRTETKEGTKEKEEKEEAKKEKEGKEEKVAEVEEKKGEEKEKGVRINAKELGGERIEMRGNVRSFIDDLKDLLQAIHDTLQLDITGDMKSIAESIETQIKAEEMDRDDYPAHYHEHGQGHEQQMELSR